MKRSFFSPQLFRFFARASLLVTAETHSEEAG